MKKKLVFIVACLSSLVLLLTGCGGSKEPAQQQANQTGKVIKVGATPVPHAEILKVVQPLLEKDGIKLEIVEFNDYVQPNLALHDKQLDANYFQHLPYLEDFNKQKGLNLTYTAKIHFEPMGLYSKKVKTVSEFKTGDKIGIPNDPTNGGRALVVLEKAGLLKLKEGVGISATVRDIVEKKVEVVELEAAQLPRSIEDLAGAVINGNFATQAKFSPADALVAEDAKSQAADTYGNILAVRSGDENREEIKKLTAALQSPEVKKFIEETYQGAVVPVF
ncbi:MetQ/NlpA family ABC transporter substrate-binding protein [Desulforamulus hydrothermalis]|uniref:Lipoprotein n=1 Tax=Desulforamulus hydrothermalis Lam5 = DSM 18033 TaxID=1121428 RepID=K8DYR9_9FIRM|nr:MetQ/NlpA family ABC transporter substrate-binding protein [Desulforamulus hydrothermalis]CCO07940.1 putative D-methionine-binding lipoprotein metQ [Desulforamulus hydrothermalis Lam5 = DSM 18033]SHG85792.1 D-methionine transport system substrate-binding protein [Desulforamulus hydrothermalis Lam5 = DSM 18033]